MINKIILDVCCGPCLVGVYPQIRKYFSIFFIFQGDNIDTQNEFLLRKENFLKVVELYNIKNYFIKEYEHNKWLNSIKGYESEQEGGFRCELCFQYRILIVLNIIEQNYLFRKKLLTNSINNFCKDEILSEFYYSKSYISTTLSISKYKNFEKIKKVFSNKIEEFNKLLDLNFYFLDKNFSENNWYNKSIKISKALNLYRQKYCGCEFSKNRKS
ncbi:MAG: epoxyqueuosine reductase QueH [Spirochaetes bacterium]|nr:epoxyqueuosine reductase QueH [Spirochaetota bacterium]